MERKAAHAEVGVSVKADKDFNKDLADAAEDAFDGVEKSGDEAGKRTGDRFSAGFRERMDGHFERIGKALGDRLGGSVGERFSARLQRSGLDKSLADAFGNDSDAERIGRNLADNIGEELADRLESQVADLLDSIEERVNKVSVSRNGAGRAGYKHFPPQGPDDPDTEAWNRAHQMHLAFTKRTNDLTTRLVAAALKNRAALHIKSNETIRKADEALAKDQQRLMDGTAKVSNEITKLAATALKNRADLHAKSNEAIRKSDEELVKAQQRIMDNARKAAEKSDKEMWAVRNATLKARIKYEADLQRGVIDKFGNSRSRGKDMAIGAVVGRMLGAGSRNNFLNVLGRSVGGLTGLVAKFGSASKTAFTTFRKGMEQAGEGANLLQRLLSGAGATGSKAFSSLAASGPAAAAAIGVVLLTASALVSVVSALAALATALASTIVSGLTGAMLALGGAIGAVVVAGGLLTMAFTAMTDAQKEAMGVAFSPLKDQLTGLGQLMLRDIIPAFETWSANLERAIYLLAPVASVMGQAFASAGNAITAALSGPGFQNLSYMLAVFLPSIVARLSVAFGSFANGAAGMFAALLPLVNRFAGYLATVSERFANWANSAKGQNAIQDFANRAVTALRSLWGFVREFFGFLSDLLFSSASQAAGNSLFDSLRDSFAGFRQAIANGDLERWFAEAIVFAGDLKVAIITLKDSFQALNDSGTLELVGGIINEMAQAFGALTTLTDMATQVLGGSFKGVLVTILSPLETAVAAIMTMVEAVEWLGGLLNKITPGSFGGNGAEWGSVGDAWRGVASGFGSSGGSSNGISNMFSGLSGAASGLIGSVQSAAGSAIRTSGWSVPSLDWLKDSGSRALSQTSPENGGRMLDPIKFKPPKYKNPYVDWAESLIKDGPSIAAQIKQAMRQLRKQVDNAMKQAMTAENAAAARSVLGDTAKNIRDGAKQTVDAAQQALNSAASSLASASNVVDAAKALAEVKRAQAALTEALESQTKANKAARLLRQQRVVTGTNVTRLLQGMRVQNATLADYAAARARITSRLETANQRLVDAIALRDSYNTQVADSVRAFGSILSAQKTVIDGVEQALTYGDITGNLQNRLAQIKAFQANLNILLSRGLSNEAYKQLVDGGVEGSGAYADALVKGGAGAVTQVNSLTSQIDAVAKALGKQSSNRLYQSGVDAAQGLVDGLESMSKRLDSAAERLGYSIAKAVKRSLGINSPSRVLMALMDDVGDGTVIGLDNQHTKVGAAAERLAAQVPVSPEVAAYTAQRNAAQAGVSGNGSTTEHHWHITTPTTDPKAVAREAINEMTGRLP